MNKEIICAGVIIDSIGRLLLVKRKYNLKSLPNHWGIPGGHIEEGETLEEAVIREVKEEVGLDFVIGNLFESAELKKEGSDTIKIINRFIGKASGNIHIQEEECDGFGWFSYEELKGLKIFSNLKITINKLKDENIIK